jgi:hypothetical protein
MRKEELSLSEEIEFDFRAEKCGVTGSGEDPFTRRGYCGYDAGEELHEIAFRG